MEVLLQSSERLPCGGASLIVLLCHIGLWWWASARRGSGTYVVRVATLRAIGLVYLAAFGTVALNFEACFGEDGLEPVTLFMGRLMGPSAQLDWSARWAQFVNLPTVLWFFDAASADAVLKLLVYSNLLLAAGVLLGISHFAALGLLWLSFLSVLNTGQRMLGYGWHPQLCEFGFLCVFLGTPWRMWDSPEDPGLCPAAVWLLRFLLFRSLFEPGVGKIFGGDPSWWPNLDALTFHYLTQPSPNPVAWFMHAMPRPFHILSCLFSHVVECVLPLAFLLPFTGARHTAAALVVLLMIALILTGNYAYLQYMMLAQTVPVFANASLASILRVSYKKPVARDWYVGPLLRALLGSGLVIFILRRSVAPLSEVLVGTRASDHSYDQWHLVNGYGAFSHMTKSRPEVVIEGRTEDGWEPVDFWCKVGNPQQKPCVISPLDFPIDWSLWFVPLGNSLNGHPWFFVLLDKIMSRCPAVLQMLRHVPANISQVQVQIYEYDLSSHGADWSQATAAPIDVAASVWRCADQRSMPWEFAVDLWRCAHQASADMASALGTSWNYFRRHLHVAWWQRRFIRTALPPVDLQRLQALLQQNGLPVGCQQGRRRVEL